MAKPRVVTGWRSREELNVDQLQELAKPRFRKLTAAEVKRLPPGQAAFIQGAITPTAFTSERSRAVQALAFVGHGDSAARAKLAEIRRLYCIEKGRLWKLANPDRYREIQRKAEKAYRARNKEKMRAKWRKQYQRRKLLAQAAQGSGGGKPPGKATPATRLSWFSAVSLGA
jgi:hypothetical protein